MRVCHVVRQYHPSVGGLESFVAALSAALNSLGCQCEVFTLNRTFPSLRALPSRDDTSSIRVRRFPFLGQRRYFWPHIPSGAFRNFDVIHVHGLDGMFERVARQRKSPRQIFVATSHGGFFHTEWMRSLKQWYFATITSRAARAYDLILAASQEDLSRLRRIAPRAIALANGVAPLGQTLSQGRDILALGRLASHKRVDRVIAALAEPPLSSVRLHVVGPEWGVTVKQLHARAVQCGVDDRVVFHGDTSAERLNEIAQACGIFASASEYEGFGMSLVEGMSVGLVPVVHANPAFTEIIERAGIGALVDFSSAKEAAFAIDAQLRQLTDSTRRAAARAASAYEWRAHAENILRLYDETLRCRGANA